MKVGNNQPHQNRVAQKQKVQQKGQLICQNIESKENLGVFSSQTPNKQLAQQQIRNNVHLTKPNTQMSPPQQPGLQCLYSQFSSPRTSFPISQTSPFQQRQNDRSISPHQSGQFQNQLVYQKQPFNQMPYQYQVIQNPNNQQILSHPPQVLQQQQTNIQQQQLQPQKNNKHQTSSNIKSSSQSNTNSRTILNHNKNVSTLEPNLQNISNFNNEASGQLSKTVHVQSLQQLIMQAVQPQQSEQSSNLLNNYYQKISHIVTPPIQQQQSQQKQQPHQQQADQITPIPLLSEEKTLLEQNIELLLLENGKLNELINKKTQENEHLRNQDNTVRENQLKQNEQTLKQQEQTLNQQEQIIENLKSEVQALKQRLEQQTEQQPEPKKNKHDVTEVDEIFELEQEVESQKTLNNQQKMVIEQLEQNNQEAVETCAQAQQEIAQKDQYIEKLQQQLVETQQNNDTLMQQCKNLETTIDQQDQQIELDKIEIHKNFEQLKEKLQLLTAENENLLEILQQKNLESINYQQCTETLQQQIQVLKELDIQSQKEKTYIQLQLDTLKEVQNSPGDQQQKDPQVYVDKICQLYDEKEAILKQHELFQQREETLNSEIQKLQQELYKFENVQQINTNLKSAVAQLKTQFLETVQQIEQY